MAINELIAERSILGKIGCTLRQNLSLVMVFAFIATSSLSPQALAQGSGKVAKAQTAASQICDVLLRPPSTSEKQLWFHPLTGQAEVVAFPPTNIKNRLINHLATLLAKSTLGLNKLSLAAQKFLADKSNDPYYVKLAKALQLEIEIDEQLLAKIPATGPLLLVTNHALNGIDGVALGAVVSQKRNDVKVVLTKDLELVPEMVNNALFVNTKGERSARVTQLIKDMKDHLDKGGALIIFPAGDPSQKIDGWIQDPVWRPSIINVVEQVQNPQLKILPVFFEGAPSAAYRASRKLWNVSRSIGPLASGLMNLREVSRQVNSSVKLSIGPEISKAEVDAIRPAKSAVQYLRARSLLLRQDYENKIDQKVERKLDPIIAPVASELIESDLNKMEVVSDTHEDNPAKGFQVFFARGDKIPNALHELGRLREITFRGVGEGSGYSHDNDEYDESYYHLISYDKSKKQIVGSYRVGLLEEVVKAKGVKGVYSSQFFNFSEQLINQLPKTIELGRSFVIKEYQRHPLALAVLLGGIAEMFVKFPQYEYLMGAVSISNEYSTNSKVAMMEFLKKYHMRKDELATAKSPPQFKTPITPEEWDLILKVHTNGAEDFNGLNQLVSVIEDNSTKKAPPLLKIYTALGVEFITFSVDTAFNTVDGFILMHMPSQSPAKVGRFFKTEERFKDLYLKHHKNP